MSTRTTHCVRGHERTPQNMYKDGRCKQCKHHRNRVYQRGERVERIGQYKTHCNRGHARTPDNVDKSGHCITCHRENNRAYYWERKAPGQPQPERRQPKTHCINGHERTPDNVTTRHRCRTCQRDLDRERYWANKGQPAPDRAETITPVRHANNVAGLTHYIQRRRQRLARHNLAA